MHVQVTLVFHLDWTKKNQRWFFAHENQVKKSTSKQRRYFVHWSYAEQSTSKRRRFFGHRNYIENFRQNDVENYRHIDVTSISNERRFEVLSIV